MGKMRNYTYGSPKFEGEINKAISEAGGDVKIYQHNIYVQANDSDNTTWYCSYAVYNTSSDELFTSYESTSADVIDVLKATCPLGGQSPNYYNNGKLYSMYVKNDNTLWGAYEDLSTFTTTKKAITSIMAAFDAVLEM